MTLMLLQQAFLPGFYLILLNSKRVPSAFLVWFFQKTEQKDNIFHKRSYRQSLSLLLPLEFSLALSFSSIC